MNKEFKVNNHHLNCFAEACTTIYLHTLTATLYLGTTTAEARDFVRLKMNFKTSIRNNLELYTNQILQ